MGVLGSSPSVDTQRAVVSTTALFLLPRSLQIPSESDLACGALTVEALGIAIGGELAEAVALYAARA